MTPMQLLVRAVHATAFPKKRILSWNLASAYPTRERVPHVGMSIPSLTRRSPAFLSEPGREGARPIPPSDSCSWPECGRVSAEPAYPAVCQIRLSFRTGSHPAISVGLPGLQQGWGLRSVAAIWHSSMVWVLWQAWIPWMLGTLGNCVVLLGLSRPEPPINAQLPPEETERALSSHQNAIGTIELSLKRTRTFHQRVVFALIVFPLVLVLSCFLAIFLVDAHVPRVAAATVPILGTVAAFFGYLRSLGYVRASTIALAVFESLVAQLRPKLDDLEKCSSPEEKERRAGKLWAWFRTECIGLLTLENEMAKKKRGVG